MQLTPMMQQYRRIKRETPPSILMFRLGDFYEMFFDDAVTASRVLGITLTAREAGKGNKVPMCGVPYHAAQEHIARLIRAGHKVAVCDQMEDPGLAKGLVKREVTRVVTPGTAIDEGLLGERDNNYLAAIHRAGGIFGLCCLDLSTGEFLVTELEREADLMGEIGRLSPSEFLLPAELAGDREFVARLRGISAGLVNQCDDWLFEREGAVRRLRELLRTQSLDGFGCAGLSAGVSAAGAVVQYLRDTGHASLGHVTRLSPYSTERHMSLDLATQRNLELVRNLRDGGREGTLISVLDRTSTAMGARLLRRWILQPLVDTAEIRGRLDAVGELAADAAASADVRKKLRERARYEVANNSYARGIVLTLANDCVGTGPRLQLLTDDAEVNRLIETEFMRWSEAVGLPAKLRALRMSRAESGEVFGLLTVNPAVDSPVKLDLQLLEADQVATPDVDRRFPSPIDGIVFDRFGNPVVPREWFLVPLFVIDEAVEKIKNGTIGDHVYDPKSASLKKRARA